MRGTSLCLLAACAASGCIDRTIGRVDPTPETVEQKTLPVSLNRELDLLFVIDDSGSMAAEHLSLETRFPELIARLDTLGGRLPDLHLGVVSSDMGTGTIDTLDSRCGPGGGDGGRLHGATCPDLGGHSFLSDVVGTDGARVRNYTGPLDAAFACAADLGTTGCGFEQHLASMQAALSPGVNPGFLRSHANLAVIILADEDDCSTDDDALFRRDNEAALGPFSDFRCFEHGVVCANDPDPRAPGPRTGCAPRTDSPYLVEVDAYADFLRGQKRDATKLYVAGIVGDPANVRVITSGAQPALDYSCSGGLGTAAPAVRLAGFLEQFPGHNHRETICTGDLGAALAAIGGDIGPNLGGACFESEPADRDLELDGLQPECSVVELTDPDGPNRREQPLPSCTDGGARPCWRITTDPECQNTAHHLRIDVDRDLPAPAGAYLEVQCVVSIPVPPPR